MQTWFKWQTTFCVFSKCANILKVVKTDVRPMQEKWNGGDHHCPPLDSPISVEQWNRILKMQTWFQWQIIFCVQVCQYSESGKNWFKTLCKKTKMVTNVTEGYSFVINTTVYCKRVPVTIVLSLVGASLQEKNMACIAPYPSRWKPSVTTV